MNKNLLIRTAVAAVAIPIILWVCYQSIYWMLGMVTLFATVAVAEFLIAEGYKPSGLVFWMLVCCVPLSILPQYFTQGIPVYLIVFVISGMLFTIGGREPKSLFTSHARLTWGIVYILLLYPFLLKIKAEGDSPFELAMRGGDWLLFLFGLLWLGDTAAMFVGKAFGKHKLAPTVSPNKTVEGFIGGIVGAIVVALILGFWRLDMIPMWQLVIIAILCSIFGQLGDLVESMWKRSLGIKDSSAIIPGHGGVLDRFDSLLFAAPVMYYAMILIGK